MKPFKHINARTIEEAENALHENNAVIIGGGTELLGTLKDNILPEYPSMVVNIKTIPGLEKIEETEDGLHVGALTRLVDIASSDLIKEKYTALAQAAAAAASPNIREMGTIAGNISQMNRCWYFRKPENRFNCIRKGGKECYAVNGQNKFHSIFGGKRLNVTPCSKECPAGTDIPGYMEQVRAGNLKKAAEIIMEVNPFPAITSRVCAHFCQRGCNRCESDESVLISGVERTVGDYVIDNSDEFYTAPENSTGKSIAIVGSGPSGLAAAYYLRKAGNDVTVYDAKEEPGGVLRYGIPAYRLPKELVARHITALQKMGIKFITNTCIGKDVLPAELEGKYDSICYATGAWKRPMIGIAGEELTEFGLDFLTKVNEWLRTNIEKTVLVTGGGNVAMDVALTAKRMGAKNVRIACLETLGEMPASAEEIERVKEEGVEILAGWGLGKVVAEEARVLGMELKKCVSLRDESGRFSPKYDEKNTVFVEANCILMAVGQQVDLGFLDEKYRIQLTSRGLIDVLDETAMTSRPGVFASGDATTGPATVIRGIANGHKAARGMNAYLQIAGSEPTSRSYNGTVNADRANEKKSAVLRELPIEERDLVKEDNTSLTENEATKEAGRCLNCGCYAVNPSDLAPALTVLNAQVVTNKRRIGIDEFFKADISGNTALDAFEIITEIYIPKTEDKSAFSKFSFRKSIDFPVVNCAVKLGKTPRVCLNAVAPEPYRAVKAERILADVENITEQIAKDASESALADAVMLNDNSYKIQIAKTILKRLLLNMQ